MSYYIFEYFINNKKKFAGTLLREQCAGHDEVNGRKKRCKNYVSIGLPYCEVHRKSIQHLDIKPSTIKRAGNGLFACDPTKSKNAIIFKEGDRICEYTGDKITQAKCDKRYDDQPKKGSNTKYVEYTAPYSINPDNKYQLDSALNRGIASLSNQNTDDKNNAELMDYPPTGLNRKVYLEATKDIKNYKEIFCNYGEEYKFDEPTSYETRQISREEYFKFGAHKFKYLK